MRFEFNNSLGVIELGLYKNEVAKRVKEFSEHNKFIMLESKHNILIKQKEYNKDIQTSHIVLFTFDDSEKLIAIRLNNLNRLDFKGVRIPGRKLVFEHKKIIKLIESGENCNKSSRCPILNKTIDLKNKECNIDYYSNCLECEHRSQQRIDSEFREFGCMLTYDMDYKKDLSIIDIDYGYNAYNMFWFINEYGDTEIQ